VTPQTLALFDLDHTLIPFDSGMAWTQFLVERGVLPAEAQTQYLAFCHQYVAGTLDIRAMHRANLQPLRRFTQGELAALAQAFEATMAPRIPAEMRSLVERHQHAGDLCAIVTATERLIALPFARLLGVNDLLATEAEIVAGRLSGEMLGEPCYREHKRDHVEAWLALKGLSLASFRRSWFYSDSASDLPLLGAVTNPVAVRPDERLRAHALAAGWAMM